MDMINKHKYILIFLVIITNIYSQNLSDSVTKSFIESLINESGDLVKFVLPEELELSNRLGINYIDTKFKFLISNDIEPAVRTKLQNKSLKYEYSIDSLGNDYSLLKFQVPSENFKREYYFYKSYLISRPYYFARNWYKLQSKYLVFHISDRVFFTWYVKNKLDAFADKMLDLLKFSETEKIKLKENKIHYFLCKDENEMELLTGYNARGLYYLPYDYIISTFNCHYHEILHLLMNYKLQEVPLYTLPLLQEGFAVAYGGRGGKDSNVILGMGCFLAQSKYLDYDSLLDKHDFYKYDATMSYPVAGLYSKFLIETTGIDNFINLYKKYSGDATEIDKIKIDTNDLPPNSAWQKYVNEYESNEPINVPFDKTEIKNDFRDTIAATKNYRIYENSDGYLFELKDTIELEPKKFHLRYDSKLYNELFPGKNYNDQKYIISANENEISVYNLYINNLIAKYVKSFSIKNESVHQDNGFFIFKIKKKIFDEPLSELSINEFNK
jgi:hypothetical protein